MAEPFLSEIRMFSFVFAPKGWALCNGQLLPINQNQALFSLLGTTFGGDGRVNFALPDLRGRTPIHVGSGHTLGERGGEQAHTLSIAELPDAHARGSTASSAHGTRSRPTGKLSWRPTPHRRDLRRRRRTCVAMNPGSVTNTGGSPGAPQHAAVPDAELLHRAAGHLPVARTRGDAMAQPYVGEIRMFAGNFAPAGWMFCEGQLLPISENETLFQLIGTTYGGDGESTFALPDLRGRIPIHQGNGFILAETGGAEEITLTVNQIPAHTHPLLGRPRHGHQATARPSNVLAHVHEPRHLQRRTRQPVNMVAAGDRAGRRQPAAHELPAVPVRRLHHFAVRDLPVARPRRSITMADPFVAEIRIFPFNFAPKGWAWCDGQLLPLVQNTALFSLLGTTYGGDGKSNFALPDLQGRAPMHPGQGPGLSLHDLGETGGSETVTLLESEIPAHSHALRGFERRGDHQRSGGSYRRRRSAAATTSIQTGQRQRRPDGAQALAPAGGDQPHNNLQPYLTFYFCIALQGVFPPRG